MICPILICTDLEATDHQGTAENDTKSEVQQFMNRVQMNRGTGGWRQ